MEKREIDEALKSLYEIKKLFAEKTRDALKDAQRQFLVWGSYQLIAPIVVYYTKNLLYFLLLLPIFFFFSQVRKGKVLKIFIYWTLSLIAYILLVRLQNPILFYAFVLVSVFGGLYITSEKSSTKGERISGLFWMNTFLFAFLFAVILGYMKAYDIMFFSWSGIILFALGAVGAFGETSLFVFSVIGNVIGTLYFILIPRSYLIFTPSVYGIMYLIYYVYIALKLRKYHG